MYLRTKFVLLGIFSLVLLPVRSAFADDLKEVLQQLNAAAKNFHTTTANFEFKTIQTDPIPDTDVQTGVTYYQRKGNNFQWAAHVHERNNGPAAITAIFSDGVFRVSDTGKESDAKAYSQFSKYESYFALGFGASGKELEDKWTITYEGTENIDGVKTDKLELVAKDPKVRNLFRKVTAWIDTARAVSLKLVFDEGEGTTRTCTYTNIKVNQGIPGDAFTFNGK